MLYVKVNKIEAEKTRRYLLDKGIYAKDYRAFSKEDYVFFPVSEKTDEFKTIKAKGTQIVKKTKISELTKEHISSFDLIGDIAIVEIPKRLEKKEKIIAKAILKVHKHVKGIFKKLGPMEGDFRIRKIKCILGKKSTETIYKEHGASMELDVARVYFSPRLSNERKRIAQLVNKENVLVMFAGVGPFAIIIAKEKPQANIIAIELNPDAVRYMEKNIVINKLHNIKVLEGDVRQVSPKNWADRICMPLPHSGEDFLKYAFQAAKNNCTIHFYRMVEIDKMPQKVFGIIEKKAQKNNIKVEIANWKVVRPYAPKVNQIVVDFIVKK